MCLIRVGLGNEIEREPPVDAGATIVQRAGNPDVDASTEVLDREMVTVYVTSTADDLGKDRSHAEF